MRVVWSRTVVGLFWFVTAAYCLLSAIPFASEQFLKPGLVPALVTFANRHPWISLGALAAAGAGLGPWLRSGHRGARALIAGWALTTVALFVLPPLAKLEPSRTALALALLSLVPPVWISLMDLRASPPDAAVRPDESDVTRDFAASALAALVVTATHAIAAVPVVLPFGVHSAGLAITSSALLHLVMFSAIFAAICVIRGVSRLISNSDTSEAWLTRCALALALAVFIHGIVLRPLSLVGATAIIVSAAFGAAFAATFGPRGTGARPGFAQALGGLAPAWSTRSWLTAIAWLASVALAIGAIQRQAAGSDWNFTIAKSAACASWLLALAATLRVLPVRVGGAGWISFALCFAVLGLHMAVSRPAAATLDAWKGRDPSIRLITDALTPPAPISDEGLAGFLQLHTNIPRSTHVAPVRIDLAPLEGAPSAVRPHVFLFVIDSLRRDYVSAYNREVSFTPALDRFARESTVFERAFTRYGATGLSVPSVWVGGLVLHKQYVTPFAPMNTLARLIDHEQYEQWISMDNILDVILPPSPRRRPLDATVQVADFRFCRTVEEIRGRLGQLKPGGPPAFVYSLPQDIHVSVINREGKSSVDDGSYPGFYAPYASRVRRLDACFGAFIDDLKTRGLFERSLIVVTADHGDSLGEEGRMGHAYTIFPEIIQVPLIVHLPSDLSARFQADPSVPAFTTDLTPTLYALLDHEPRQPAAFFGRALFRRKGSAEPSPSGEPQLVASSYGSVYGTLLDSGRRLYIVDAIGLQEHLYELDGTAAGRRLAIGAEDRIRGQRAIRATVEEIAKFSGYRP